MDILSFVGMAVVTLDEAAKSQADSALAQAHAGWVQVGLNLLLLVLTIISLCVLWQYARDTKQLALDTRKLAEQGKEQLENAQMPFVVLNKKANEYLKTTTWAFDNQGWGTALNIEGSCKIAGDEDGDSEDINLDLSSLAAGNFEILVHPNLFAVISEYELKYQSLSGMRYATNMKLEDDKEVTTFRRDK